MRIIPNDYLEASTKFLDLPFDMKKLLDEEGNPSSIKSFMEKNNGVIIYNQDQSRALVPFELSHDDGDYEALEEAVKNPDLKALFDGKQPYILKQDLINTDEEVVRILNYSKFVEIKNVNGKWQFKEEDATFQ